MADEIESEGPSYRNGVKAIEEELLRKRERVRSVGARYAAVLLMAFLSAGCTSIKPTYTQNGLPGYTITCPSGSREKCYAKAGEACGQRGYDISRQSEGGHFNIVVSCKTPAIAEEPVTIPLIPQFYQ